MSLLEVNNLTKSFERGSRSFKAVDGVNLSVQSGDFLYIVGRSGSGKTTLLNLIAGILKPSEGSVSFDGENVHLLDDNKLSLYRNESIGYVPQSLGTMPNLSVSENVELPFYLANRSGGAKEKAHILLDRMGILHLRDEFPRSLSGGELKRVLLARAMINNPKIIIADEPTADLDIDTTREIMSLLCKINEDGTTLIIVTHESEILDFGSKIMTMSDGRLE